MTACGWVQLRSVNPSLKVSLIHDSAALESFSRVAVSKPKAYDWILKLVIKIVTFGIKRYYYYIFLDTKVSFDFFSWMEIFSHVGKGYLYWDFESCL